MSNGMGNGQKNSRNGWKSGFESFFCERACDGHTVEQMEYPNLGPRTFLADRISVPVAEDQISVGIIAHLHVFVKDARGVSQIYKLSVCMVPEKMCAGFLWAFRIFVGNGDFRIGIFGINIHQIIGSRPEIRQM